MKNEYWSSGYSGIIEENGKFGLVNSYGYILLPIEYDSIFEKPSDCFFLQKNGKFGYVKFEIVDFKDPTSYSEMSWGYGGHASVWIPCVYDRIEFQQNGLVLDRIQDGEIQTSWYDFSERILHPDLLWMKNFGKFDAFDPSCYLPGSPFLKKAGENAYAQISKESNVTFLQEIPIDVDGVQCILCRERIEVIEKKYGRFPLIPKMKPSLRPRNTRK